MTNKVYWSKFIVLLLIMMLLLVACGGGGAEGPTSSPEPTETLLPTYEFIESTNPPAFDPTDTPEATTESEDEVVLDPKLVGRGLGRYEALECGTCHGVTGEGTDDGSALTSFDMPEEPFVTFMRSGGEIGSSHQYSTDRLSKNGAANLFQYLLSLAQGE